MAAPVFTRCDGFQGEADYFIRRGFPLMARYDRLNQNATDTGRTHSQAWAVGAQKALTDLGNMIIRGSYTRSATKTRCPAL